MKRIFFWRKSGDESDAADPGPADDRPGGLWTGDAAQDAQSLEILLHSIAEVSASIDLDRVLEDIVDKSLEVTDAERGVILLGSRAEDLDVRIARDRDGRDLGTDPVYSKTLLGKCLETAQPIRSVVQSDQEALELGQSVYNLKLRAVMCAPLIARERTVGVIYVDSKAVRREFTARDEALFGAMTAQLAIAIENARLYQDSLQKVRLEKDFEIARRIQSHLLPDVPEQRNGLEFALEFRALDEASGDSYDFIELADGRIVVFIGDVTGHGIGAALLAHAAQAALRSYCELLDDLSEVAARLNNRLVEGVETGNFMSCILLSIDPKERTFRYVNCGHPSLLHIREGRIEEHGKTGMVLGVVADQEFPSNGPIELCPGDALFMHTDGVDETMNAEREVFGSARLLDVLSKLEAGAARDFVAAVERATADHANGIEQDDDLTMVAIRVGGA